jgi:hypothetical protein
MVILGARWLAQMRGQSGRHTSASVPSSSELERAWRPGLPAIVNPGAGSPRSMAPAMHGHRVGGALGSSGSAAACCCMIRTGAGGDNGIAKLWNRRELSASSDDDQSHYLHPHP